MGKYFGTDGIRGIANDDLDAMLAFNVGRAISAVLSASENRRPMVLIGKDTRISSDFLESALIAGLCGTGSDVRLLGVIATPAVAYLTKKYGADAGIVISASHNPYAYNGIKIFNSDGYKLNDDLEMQIEAYLDYPNDKYKPAGPDVGRVTNHAGYAIGDYIRYLAATAKGNLSGLKIAIDCANGAASSTAPALFGGLMADVRFFFTDPDGVNINAGCGSTDLLALSKRVKEDHYDIGIALDGDADRCLIIDDLGREVDGDKILAILATDMKEAGTLSGNTFVATVMSNLGMREFAANNGIHIETSDVGDRFVLEKMLAGGYDLGGEQSGHIIFGKLSTAGDGQLTAIQFLRYLKKTGKKCSELADMIPKYPQITMNCFVTNDLKQKTLEHETVKQAIMEAEQRVAPNGRILVRPSGTETLIRVMAEGKDRETTEQAVRHVVDAIDRCTLLFH